MAVGQSFLGSEQILGRDEGFVAQQAAEGLDFFLGPIGEVGQGALAGFVAFAPALAEEDGGRGVAVGDGFDVHGSYYAHLLIIVKDYMSITWEHFHRVKLGLRSNKSETYRRIWSDFFWNFGLEVSHNFLRQFSSAHARIGHPHRVQMDHRISFEHIKGMAE